MHTGAIAAGDIQTAEAGAEILRAGGTAVDAVVAAAAAAFVCEPMLCSPAGGGVLLAGAAGDLQALDLFSAVPGLGGQPESLDFFPIEVQFGPTTQVFHVGRGSAAVPGALRGLLEAHDRYGRLPLATVLAPAVHLAREGAVLGHMGGWVVEILDPICRLTPGSRALYAPGGALVTGGDTLRNPELAGFLEAIGRDRAEAMRAHDACLLSAVGVASGGLLSRADLEAWEPVWRAPLRVDHRGHTVLTPPPPTSGGALVSLGLRLAAHLDLGGWLSPQHLTGVARILRGLTVARVEGLDEHLTEPGWVEALLARPPERLAESYLGSTTHISVLDGEGGVASLTVSNGEGSGHVLPKLGIQVNNFLGEEDINPLGFHRQPAGTRLTTMMTPTVVLDGGQPVLALGSGGSNRIRSVLLQVLVGVLDHGRPIDAAIRAPRMHTDDGVHLLHEVRDPEVLTALSAEWPELTAFAEPHLYFGGVHAAGTAGSAGDARRDGVAVLT